MTSIRCIINSLDYNQLAGLDSEQISQNPEMIQMFEDIQQFIQDTIAQENMNQDNKKKFN